MAYQVLARKWRPQRFDELRGQQHIVRALTNAIRSGRIAHAFLFSGIRGVGKTSAARILAKALNCEGGPTPEPCNTCRSCREITDGHSPDVLEIDGASNTGVDDVRRLREAVRYPPVRGAYRVYIIDEVHMLSTAAFNALLKTLEEPPGHVVFVFATTDPHKVPATIVSRCQQFDFKRLSGSELVSLLGELCTAEGIEAEERALAAIAREAEGSVRDAQSLLDQVIAFAGTRIAYGDVRDVLGVVDRELLLGIGRDIIAGDARAVLEGLDRAERFGMDAGRFGQDLLELFRDLCVLTAVDGGRDLVDLAPEEADEALGFLDGARWEDVHARFDILSRGLEAVRTSPRPGLVLEMTLLKMARLPPVVNLAELLGAGDGERPQAPGRPRPSRAPRPARPEPSSRGASAPPTPSAPREEDTAAAADPEPAGDPPATAPAGEASGGAGNVWVRALELARARNRAFWSVLREHGRLRRWDAEGRRALVEVDPDQEFFLRSKLDLMREVLGEACGGKVRVEIRTTRPASGGPGGGSRESDRSRHLKKEAAEHPLVRDAMELFDGTLEDVRVLKR